MANLSPTEMLKEASGRRPDRVAVFLKKYQQKEPFQLDGGSMVTLHPSLAIIQKLQQLVKVNSASRNTRPNQQLLGALVFQDVQKKKKYHLDDFAKTAEFGGGGAGANTELNESAQAVYCAARWQGKNTFRYTPDVIKEALESYDVDISLRTPHGVVKKLPESWQESSRLIADKLYTEYSGKKYTFHRGSSWVKKLEDHFKKLNKELPQAQQFSQVNKWTPADIWMVAKGKENALDFRNIKDMLQLNAELLKHAKSGDILGVSLKFVSHTPKFTKLNFTTIRPKIKFISMNVDGGFGGAADFFRNSNVSVEFSDDGEIRYRTFGTTERTPNFAGEIAGEEAAQGKIGLGVLSKFYRIILGKPAPEYQDVLDGLKPNNRKKFFTDFHKFAKTLSKDSNVSRMTTSEFEKQIAAKPTLWIISKYIGCHIMYDMNLATPKKRDDFISATVLYAASQTELSAPFIKLGG